MESFDELHYSYFHCREEDKYMEAVSTLRLVSMWADTTTWVQIGSLFSYMRNKYKS